MSRIKRGWERLKNPLSWFRKSVPEKRSRTRNHSDCATILLSPIYEPITRQMRTWLDSGLQIPDGLGKQCRLSGPDINRTRVATALKDVAFFKTIKIFCGHGTDEALLGPPQKTEPIITIGEIEHSAIYDIDMVQPTKLPSSLFAFCCDAGKKLGKKFCSYKGRTFLGYNNELPIETENDECLNTFKRIFQTVASEIIEAGEVEPRHERQLKNLYHEAYLYFFQGEGRSNGRARYMWLALNEHRRFVCRYGGRP